MDAMDASIGYEDGDGDGDGGAYMAVGNKGGNGRGLESERVGEQVRKWEVAVGIGGKVWEQGDMKKGERKPTSRSNNVKLRCWRSLGG